MSLAVSGSDQAINFKPKRLVIAGYTGRDEESVRRHIDELAQAGVAPPTSVPTFYSVDLEMLTFEDTIAVNGADTSGEAEPVLFCASEGWYVGVGSDHTDRRLERSSVEASKRACPKVASREVLPFDRLRRGWDRLRLRGFADGVLHQDSALAEIQPVNELVDGLERTVGVDAEGLVLFMGTVPTLDGEFRFAEAYACEIAGEDGEVLLRHSYRLQRRH